jgi:hypothetical protein
VQHRVGGQFRHAEQCVGGGRAPVEHSGQEPPHRPLMISDFLSRERFHRLGVYTEFYRHVPVEHQIAIGLP